MCWLVGYLATARMLWRAPWLFPIGLVGVNLATAAFQALSSRLVTKPQPEIFTQRATLISISALCIVLIGYFSISKYQTGWQSLKDLQAYKLRLEKQAALGEYLETNIREPSVFLASYGLMNHLPGLSSKAKVVYFRSGVFTPYPVNASSLQKCYLRIQTFHWRSVWKCSTGIISAIL